MKKEKWKPIDNFPNYAISNRGRVRSCNATVYSKAKRISKMLKPSINSNGYFKVCLYKHGKRTTCKIHCLVLETFVSKRPTNLVCNHKDGDKLNNNVENLEWITQGENNLHAYRTGLKKATGPKLTEEEAHQIKQILAKQQGNGPGRGHYLTQSEIGKLFNVSPQTISQIKNGKTWKHI